MDCVYRVLNIYFPHIETDVNLYLYYCFDVPYYAAHASIIPDKYVTLCSLIEVLLKCDAHVSND